MIGGNLVIWLGLMMFLGLPAMASEQIASPPKGEVARAQFTTAIVDREPVNNVVVLGEHEHEIYFFSDLVNLKDQTVVHRWEFGGKVQSRVEFNVTSDRWRANSKKALNSNQYGIWTVVVEDQQGWPLKAVLFEYAEGVTKLLDD